MAKTKKTTLDDLARMVKSGFDEVEKRMDKNEQNIDLLKESSERIELRLANVAL